MHAYYELKIYSYFPLFTQLIYEHPYSHAN
jgi:hypothetical protein